MRGWSKYMKLMKRLKKESAKLLMATVVLSTAIGAQPVLATTPTMISEVVEATEKATTETVEIREVRSRKINGGPTSYSLGISTRVLGIDGLKESQIHIKVANKEDMSDAREISTTKYDYDSKTGYSVVHDFTVTDTDSDGYIYVELTVDGSTKTVKKYIDLKDLGRQYCTVNVSEQAIYTEANKKLTVPIHISEDGYWIVREEGATWNNVKYRKKGAEKWTEMVYDKPAVDDSYFLEIANVEPGEEYEVWAKIRYYTPNGLRVFDEQTITITVPETQPEGMQGIRLHTPDRGLYSQQTYQLTYDILPEGVQHGALAWSSSAGNYIDISSTGLVRVTANPSKPMRIKINLEVDGFKDSTYITIMPVVGSVSIKAPIDNVFEGDEVQLEYSISPAGAVPNSVTFTSKKPDVVSVDDTGKIRVLQNVRDSVGITLTADGKSSTCYVKVKPKILNLALDKTSLEMEVGEKAKLTAITTPEGQGFDGSEYLKWTSSHPEVVSVKKTSGFVSEVVIKEEITDPVTITATITDFQGTVKTATCTINPKAEVVDKTELQTLLEQANGLNPLVYTEQSWLVLELAKEEATIIMDKETATQQEVDTAKAKLQQAIDQLLEGSRKLSFTDSIITLEVGASHELSYQIVEKAKMIAIWGSGDTQIASVTQDGHVVANKAGITTVTVQIGDQQAICIINVLGEESKDVLRDTINQIIENMGEEEHQQVYERNDLYAYIVDTLAK